jgi:hypothetical protein
VRSSRTLLSALVAASLGLLTRTSGACDVDPKAPVEHVTHAHTFAPGLFVDYSFGAAPGLGIGLRGSYLSHGSVGIGGFGQVSWRAIPHVGGSTWRVDAGGLFTPVRVWSEEDDACGLAIHPTPGAYFQVGASVHGAAETAPVRASGMAGAYGSAMFFAGVTGFFPFFGDARGAAAEAAISLGVEVPVMVARTLEP